MTRTVGIPSQTHPWSKLAVRDGNSGPPSNLASDPLTSVPPLSPKSPVISPIQQVLIERLLYTSEQDRKKSVSVGEPG